MRRALVTGASGPIGRAISAELARRGFHVILQANRNLAEAEAGAAEIAASGGSAEALALDLSDMPGTMERLAALAEEAPVQVLVHNAGIRRDMPFAAIEPADWQAVIDVNLNGFYAALRPLILPMMRTRWGRIVAISSLTAILGNRGQSVYAAAKGGYLALAKTLTREYGSRGITANVVAPGLIATPATEALENYAELAALSPMRRAGRPEEVAALVGFLASDDSGYISGQIFPIDGGTS